MLAQQQSELMRRAQFPELRLLPALLQRVRGG